MGIACSEEVEEGDKGEPRAAEVGGGDGVEVLAGGGPEVCLESGDGGIGGEGECIGGSGNAGVSDERVDKGGLGGDGAGSGSEGVFGGCVADDWDYGAVFLVGVRMLWLGCIMGGLPLQKQLSQEMLVYGRECRL